MSDRYCRGPYARGAEEDEREVTFVGGPLDGPGLWRWRTLLVDYPYQGTYRWYPPRAVAVWEEIHA